MAIHTQTKCAKGCKRVPLIAVGCGPRHCLQIFLHVCATNFLTMISYAIGVKYDIYQLHIRVRGSDMRKWRCWMTMTFQLLPNQLLRLLSSWRPSRGHQHKPYRRKGDMFSLAIVEDKWTVDTRRVLTADMWYILKVCFNLKCVSCF